jgi:hypothetical protein
MKERRYGDNGGIRKRRSGKRSVEGRVIGRE